MAYRLPEPVPFPSARVLIPIVGVWKERWRLVSSLIVEIVTAALFVGLALQFGQSIELLISAAYTALFVTVGYIDVDHRLVLNRLSYPAAILAVPASMAWPGFGWQRCLLGAIAGGLIFVVLQFIGRGALGTGDTKLAVVIGAVHGFPDVFGTLFYGMALGGVGALLAWLVFRRGRKSYIAYAPYLAAGAILAFFTSS